jgi:hypothetical protein
MNKTVPVFDVEYPYTPISKWKPVIDHFGKDELRDKVKSLKSLIPSIISLVIDYLPLPTFVYYREEIEYLSKELDISPQKLLCLNLIYELSSACTTCCFPGEKFMVRSMDWDLPLLKDLTFTFNFVGHHFATTWVGCIGYFTASSSTEGLVINWHKSNGGLVDRIRLLFSGYYPVRYVVREFFENKKDESYLLQCSLVSPVYFTYMNFKTGEHYRLKRFSSTSIKNNTFYTVNHDDDNYGTCNCVLLSGEREKLLLEQYKPDMSKTQALELYKMYPVLNKETIYVTYMDSSTHQTCLT